MKAKTIFFESSLNDTTKKLFGVFLLILVFPVNAQSWQWGKKGGATDPLAQSTEREEAISMCTDVYGNVYITSIVGRTNLQIAGNPKTTYSDFGENDVAVVAFSCEGNYKWSKVIGGYYGAANSIQVAADGIGNVYVEGQVIPVGSNVTPSPHFDSDVVLQTSPNTTDTFKQSLFLIKYDSEGNYKWHRLPQAADVSHSITQAARVIGLEADANGNTYSLCILHAGTYADGQYTVASSGVHLLKYNSNGAFIGGTMLDMQVTLGAYTFKMKRNHNTGNIYITGVYESGFGTVSIGGVPITHGKYLAAFDSTGSVLWKKENEGTLAWAGNLGYNVDIDSENNIYFSGMTGRKVDNEPDSFNGIPFTTGPTPWPFIVKLDPSGNTIWQTNGTKGTQRGFTVNGNEVAVTGGANNMNWQTLNYQQDANSGGHPYLARFNKTTGAIIGINAVYSTGDDSGTALTSDSKNNYYLGGRFSSSMTAGSDTFTSSGGGSDFFVAKFGSNDCNFMATDIPVMEGLNMYPNPVKDYLHLNNMESYSYTLYGMLGTTLESGNIEANGKISLQKYAAGIYILQLENGSGQMKRIKVIKK